MDSSTDQLGEYKAKLSKEAETLLLNMPARVKELEDLLAGSDLSLVNPSRVVVDLDIPVPASEDKKNGDLGETKKRKLDDEVDMEGSKVFVLPNGIVKTNPTITRLLKLVKPHLRQLVQDTNLLKMWIRWSN